MGHRLSTALGQTEFLLREPKEQAPNEGSSSQNAVWAGIWISKDGLAQRDTKLRVGKPPLLTRGGSEGSRKIALGNRLLTNGRTRSVNLHILLFMTPGLKELE